jgi:4-carboxymuconolactone decarboxylase
MRLPRLSPQEMTPRQREVHDHIAGKRGKFRGPYQIWIQNPELCERQEAMTSYCRWECSLPEKLREFALLLAARACDAQYSWNAHVDPAIRLGISPEVIAAVAEKRRPQFVHEDERVFYAFATELLEEHFVSPQTFAQARALFGEAGVVDIVACLGAFVTLSMCLNAFEVDLQADRPPPFPDIRGFARVGSGETHDSLA